MKKLQMPRKLCEGEPPFTTCSAGGWYNLYGPRVLGWATGGCSDCIHYKLYLCMCVCVCVCVCVRVCVLVSAVVVLCWCGHGGSVVLVRTQYEAGATNPSKHSDTHIPCNCLDTQSENQDGGVSYVRFSPLSTGQRRGSKLASHRDTAPGALLGPLGQGGFAVPGLSRSEIGLGREKTFGSTDKLKAFHISVQNRYY